jgi:hypothetical protein
LLSDKLQKKRTRITDLKKSVQDAESRCTRVHAKMAELAKFSKTLINVLRHEQKLVKDHITREHDDFRMDLDLMSVNIVD